MNLLSMLQYARSMNIQHSKQDQQIQQSLKKINHKHIVNKLYQVEINMTLTPAIETSDTHLVKGTCACIVGFSHLCEEMPHKHSKS